MILKTMLTILKIICLKSIIKILISLMRLPKIVMQIPKIIARTTTCKILSLRNGSMIFCGIADKIISKIIFISSEKLTLKSKFITGKNKLQIKIDRNVIKIIIAKNLFKIFVPTSFSIETSSILQILATIEIKISGIFTATNAPNKVFRIGFKISFTKIFWKKRKSMLQQLRILLEAIKN